MKDERVMQSMNKIWGEIGRLAYYLAAASFVVKCLFFGFKLEDCILEYVIMIGAPIYQLFRMHQLKLAYNMMTDKRRYWKRESVVMLTRSELDVKEALISLVAFIVSFQAVRLLIVTREEKRARRLEKEFEEDTQD